MSAINRSILWKLIITALVVIWAVSAMIPFSDTPFETYIQTRATANQEEFAKILKAAEARVDKLAAKNDKSKSPTLYIALRDYADAGAPDSFEVGASFHSVFVDMADTDDKSVGVFDKR